MCNIIIMLILTLNVVINQLHAADQEQPHDHTALSTIDNKTEVKRWKLLDQRPKQLLPGMWGTKSYEVTTAEYTPLTDEYISTPFFVQLASQSTEIKKKVLKLAKRIPVNYGFNAKAYLTRRRNIAAVIRIAKTDPKLVQMAPNPLKIFPLPNELRKNNPQLLHQATDMNDVELVQLLINSGADLYEENIVWHTPIYAVKTVAVAQVFIAKGAHTMPLDNSLDTPLHWAVDKNREPALIKLFINNGVDPTERNEFGWTALMSIASHPNAQTITRASLLTNIERAKVDTLLKAQSRDGRTVFAIIADEKKYRDRESFIQLQALESFLLNLQQHGMPSCILCSQPFHLNPIAITQCAHTAHTACLAAHSTCPHCQRSLK